MKKLSFFVLSLLLVFSFFLSSCNTKVKDGKPQKNLTKRNKLEKTQWKATAMKTVDSDVLLDFCTHENVQEFITLPNGKEVKSRVGTYRISKSDRVKIKFGKLSRDQLDGRLKNSELIITERLSTRTYYKVKDYN